MTGPGYPAPTTPTATAVATPMPPAEPAEPDVDSALTELARGKINNNAIASFFILNITGSYLIKIYHLSDLQALPNEVVSLPKDL